MRLSSTRAVLFARGLAGPPWVRSDSSDHLWSKAARQKLDGIHLTDEAARLYGRQSPTCCPRTPVSWRTPNHAKRRRATRDESAPLRGLRMQQDPSLPSAPSTRKPSLRRSFAPWELTPSDISFGASRISTKCSLAGAAIGSILASRTRRVCLEKARLRLGRVHRTIRWAAGMDSNQAGGAGLRCTSRPCWSALDSLSSSTDRPTIVCEQSPIDVRRHLAGPCSSSPLN